MEPWETEGEAGTADQESAQNYKPPRPKKRKKKPPMHTIDIDISALPLLSEILSNDPDPIVGLQYIWEYRSPSQTVLPHYQCKLCSYDNTQPTMIIHIKGWKHIFKYVTKHHPDKITFEGKEMDDFMVNNTKKEVKKAAAKLEKIEGRGEIKVILKEPYEVPFFQSLTTAYPRDDSLLEQGIKPVDPPVDISSLPSLSEVLKDDPDPIVGLQYICEYRSPSKTVPPHYQCELCSIEEAQPTMIIHIKGWKHIFKYMTEHHFEKINYLDKETYNIMLCAKKESKTVAAEVEKLEGRGEIKVILKEPYEVPAFQSFTSAYPKADPPLDQGMESMDPPFGPRFHDSRFSRKFPPHGGPPSDFPSGRYKESGRRMSTPAFPDRGSAPVPLLDLICTGRNGFGRDGPMVQGPKTVYPKDYQENFRDRLVSQPNNRPGILGPAPQSNNTQAFLKHLETFRIENENDAQLVLKVTKTLTDALMEYRLRNIPVASPVVNPSMMPTNLSNAPPRLQGDGYSSSSFGPSRYPDGPQRY